mgnify:CR=1 FL=1
MLYIICYKKLSISQRNMWGFSTRNQFPWNVTMYDDNVLSFRTDSLHCNIYLQRFYKRKYSTLVYPTHLKKANVSSLETSPVNNICQSERFHKKQIIYRHYTHVSLISLSSLDSEFLGLLLLCILLLQTNYCVTANAHISRVLALE